MISSLRIPGKVNVDVDQTKLAIAILREISAAISVPPHHRNQFNRVTHGCRPLSALSGKDQDGFIFSTPQHLDQDSCGSYYTTAEEGTDFFSEDDNDKDSVNFEEENQCGSDTDEMMLTLNDNNFQSSKSFVETTTGTEECNDSLLSRCNINRSNRNHGNRSGKLKSKLNLIGGTYDFDESPRADDNREDNLSRIKYPAQTLNEEVGLGLFDEVGNNRTINVAQLGKIFDVFKVNELPTARGKMLLDLVEELQNRDDFQWALHQLGGFNAIIFLYARIVEICPNEDLQSKALSVALAQIRHEMKLTDSPLEKRKQYHLIRFVLNSPRSIFGFQTFLTLINACLGGNGTQIKDYQLLSICMIRSWKNLLRKRCSEEDSPSGDRSLFEVFLTIILDLCVESNSLRDLNVGLLKVNGFAERILSICNGKFSKTEVNTANLSVDDALRIGSLVKSIFLELMAPPDANVAVTLVRFGLLPLLPKELPPLPLRQDSFFNYHQDEEVDVHDGKSGADNNNLLDYSNNLNEMSQIQNNLNSGVPMKSSGELNIMNGEEFIDALQETLLEGIMSIILNAFSILPDLTFHSVLNPYLSPHIFVACCSHPNATLKFLALKLLSAYLSRVKNPDLLNFVKSKGFALTSLYIQACPEIAHIALNTCKGFGPISYFMVVGLIYSNTIVKALNEWIQEDEATVVPALLSAGLLPSILNLHSPKQKISRPLSQLLSSVTRYMVLNPISSPWKILFCPGIESASQSSPVTARLIQDSTEMLRTYHGKGLKKSDAADRLLWLIERSTGSKLGSFFDKWLLNIFALHIMEMEESDETEAWRYFVKKNRKRVNYLMGVFLCKLLAPDTEDFEFKQYTIRFLYMSCPNLHEWLPKIIRRDEHIERCFTAFLRVFFSEVDKQQTGRAPSFQSLVSSNGNLVLTLQTAAAIGVPSAMRNPGRKESIGADSICESDIHLSDKALKCKFEEMLVQCGVLSLSNNFRSSTFSPDFKTFKILIEEPPISGVSYQELRQCLALVDKMKASSSPKSASYTNMLKIHNAASSSQFLNSTAYFNSVFETASQYAEEVLDILTRLRTRQEVEIAKCICRREHDIIARQKWWMIRQQMTHPKAPWHFPELYPNSWTLDQSEGPGRIRLRLRKQALKIEERFIKSAHRKTGSSVQPLEYLFQSDSAEFMGYPGIQTEIQLIRSCLRIVPGEESPGEIVISSTSLHFISEVCTQSCWNRVDVEKSRIRQIERRRYTLEDRAAEIFVESRSFLFVFRTFQDREVVIRHLSPRSSSFSNTQSISPTQSQAAVNPTPLATIRAQWVKGNLSNFDYLMFLNTAAGRTYCDLMQYPVFPFVLAKYDTSTLDLNDPSSYRNLTRPMAIQDPAKEAHFISTYNYLKRESDSTPFHYGSHYSNSGIVLHFLVRLPPYTQHFLKYQDGNFDIPDRSFHNIETMWRLASKESNTDFKEAIPEFYYLPEFLKNLQNFDLGVRQNGSRVEDVKLPPWANGDARLFTLINRQALESNQVRNFLSDWIDLIFGYKQTGPASVEAINVFHPSTYEGFEVNGSGTDEIVRKARKAMVATYGQTPKRLFVFPHPKPQYISYEENPPQCVLDGITGLQWGNFVGSPTSGALDVVNTREFREPVALFETQGRIVFWPKQTVIMGETVVGSWDASGVRVKSNIIYLCIGDEISTCRGLNNSLWIGHRSGRISVLKLSAELDEILETIELIGHYAAIKSIDLNEEFSTAITCSGENYVILWDTNTKSFINFIEESENIDAVYSSRSTGEIALLCREKNLIKFKTINGFDIGAIRPDERIESVCVSGLNPGKNVNLIAVGCDYGEVRFYSTWDLKFVNQIKIVNLSTLAIQSIRYSPDGRRLYCMGESENSFISVAVQLSPNN